MHTRVREGHGTYVPCRISKCQLVQRSCHGPGLSLLSLPGRMHSAPNVDLVRSVWWNWTFCHFSVLGCQDHEVARIMKCDKSWHLVLCHCSVQLCHLATRNRWAVVLHWGMSGLQAPHKQKSKQLCSPEKWTRLGEDRSMKYHDASEKINLWSKFAFPTSLISVVEDWT